ncbi:hypothetical protein [Pedobacter terrae]|uniref:hypothetical protein n=1 Tax=Pedobacter terrae TaxID=405671 RepID=UPI002FF9B0B5
MGIILIFMIHLPITQPKAQVIQIGCIIIQLLIKLVDQLRRVIPHNHLLQGTTTLLHKKEKVFLNFNDMIKFFFTLMILLTSALSFAQNTGSCKILKELLSNQKKSVTVLAQKIASVKVHKGPLLKKIALQNGLDIKKISYCGQIIIEGCRDTVVLVNLDNSSFAFNAVSKSGNELFKVVIVAFPNPSSAYSGPYVMIDKIIPRDYKNGPVN